MTFRNAIGFGVGKMSAKSVYKSLQGEAELTALYDRQLDSLNIDFEEQMVDTRFGRTHVLITGPKNAPPLMIFHGGNSTNPYNLKGFLPLLSVFRVYAPDAIGHPGKSVQTCLSVRNESYGKWASDIIRELGLKQVACIGGSYGGGILIRLASYAPELISKAVLIVPSGIANSKFIYTIKNFVVPLLNYNLYPSRKNLIRVISPLTPNANDDTIQMIELIFKHYKVKAQMPRNAKEDELRNFKAPTYIIAAEKDVLFPGEAVIAKAKKTIPNITKTELLRGHTHMFVQDKQLVLKVNENIMLFLKD